MTPSEASKLVTALAAHYPNLKLTLDNVMAYERSLMELDYHHANAAIERLVRTHKFFPTISEIHAVAAELACGSVRSGAEAYAEVMLAVRRHGRCYGDSPAPKFDDPLIPQCLRVWGGSWNDVCNSPENDAAGRARFIELYDSLARQRRQDVVAGRVLPETNAVVSRLLAKIGGGNDERR